MINEQFKDFITKSNNIYTIQLASNYLTYLNTRDLIIYNNFYGLLAYGSRYFNYDDEKVYIYYQIKNENISVSEVERLLKKYEKLLNHGKEILIIRSE